MQTYDPAKLLFSIGGLIIGGYADGTFLEVERDEDAFTKTTGASGETARAKNNHKGGSITLTLMSTSLSNDFLTAIAIADELTGAGVVPCFGKELNGTTAFASAQCWIKKLSKVDRSKEISTTQWVIDCADLELAVGGLL